MKTLTILSVEDCPIVARILKAIFNRPDVRLIQAATIREGYRLAIEEHPHLILMDVRLPDGNGLDLARRLREDPTTWGIPTIALSGMDSQQLKAEAAEAGCFDALPKPVDVYTLAFKVARALGRTRDVATSARRRAVCA